MPRNDPFDTTGYGTGDGFTAGTLAPGSAVPVARSIDVKGGSMQVETIADRDAIPGALLARDDPAQFRQEGMTVYVQATGLHYRLEGGIANANWQPFGQGVTQFTGLTDTPANYAGAALQVVRVNAGETGLEFAPAAGGAPTATIENNTGGVIENGSILARSATVGASAALDVVKADSADITLRASRAFAVLTSGDVADAAQGTATFVGPVSMRMKAGLALNVGDDVFLSDVVGEGTNEVPIDGAGGVIAAGGSVQRVGILLHPLSYDGAGNRLALVALNFGQRRTAQA